ncbi:MAG: YdiU family protein [Legionella sp.]|nr:YdiU family protein [Legionella sp.]
MMLNFDNSFSRLPGSFYSKQKPVAVTRPELVHVNQSAARLLDLAEEDINVPDFASYFSGNTILKGSDPLAMVYAGHQFGYYVPQLGDGRALLLGEVVNNKGERWDVQLKGSGITPYSRMGDGRAVLRSTIREYLCAEAMNYLGIPTTRALCIISTNELVYRDVPEPGAILTRLSLSHIRFGHFEYFYYTNQHDALKELANYVLQRHYPDMPFNKEGYLHLYREAVIKTAKLIAQWQAFGFCHGVMNTDNMSIIGLTIDYGPFGFLDNFNPGHICNSSDCAGRYAYNQQPQIAQWNLIALAQALTPLIEIEQLNEALQLFMPEFHRQYFGLLRQKIGLKKAFPTDEALINDLLKLLATNQVDYTLFFRALATLDSTAQNNNLTDFFTSKQIINEWLIHYTERLTKETVSKEERRLAMNKINPKYILRNYLAEKAIEDAYDKNDYDEIAKLHQLLQKPFDEQPDNKQYAVTPPDWSHKISISCSS